jgi:hypothetical protein
MQVGVSSDLRERGQCWGSRDLVGGLATEGRACTVRQLPCPSRKPPNADRERNSFWGPYL